MRGKSENDGLGPCRASAESGTAAAKKREEALTLPYAALKPSMRPLVLGNCSSGTIDFRISSVASQNFSCSALSSTTRRVDWELKDDGTCFAASLTMATISLSEMGASLLSP